MSAETTKLPPGSFVITVDICLFTYRRGELQSQHVQYAAPADFPRALDICLVVCLEREKTGLAVTKAEAKRNESKIEADNFIVQKKG